MTLRELLWPDVDEDTWNSPSWQIENRLKGIEGLALLPFLKDSNLDEYGPLLNRYRWASTPYFLNLMEIDRPNDPVKAQVIPNLHEIAPGSPISSPDPLYEHAHMPIKGLIHRYADRALMLLTNYCFSYCRHCNRKRAWTRPESFSFKAEDFMRLERYLNRHKEIREIILSGGDPLTLPLDRLETVLSFLKNVNSIEVIRIGTRVPVVLPMAITDELCNLLKQYRPIWVVTHFNHPVELTSEARAAMERIQLCGIPIANQTVLLKGVNDETSTLASLFRGLQAMMVRPYYIFNCDYVLGVEHFRVPLKRGIEMMRDLWGNIGGMCMPTFVTDLPYGMGKATLLPSNLIELDEKGAVFRTFEGRLLKIDEC